MKHPLNSTLEEGPITAIDRLASFIASKKMNFREFEGKIDLGNGYLRNQLKRKGGIGSNIILKIVNVYPELNIVWLITGKQKMIIANQHKVIKQRKTASTKLRASA